MTAERQPDTPERITGEALIAWLERIPLYMSTYYRWTPMDEASLRAALSAVREGAELRKRFYGATCPTHGRAVLMTHVDDGEPCADYLLANREDRDE